ncbi:hypothetical protein FXO37_13729 [Capsicum annuum]|nr:hypothetical protein FXO37_13729 [Capsicum annuum]
MDKEKGQETERKKYYFLVANAKFMLDEEEQFQEEMFERRRLYGEHNKEPDFWLEIEPSRINAPPMMALTEKPKKFSGIEFKRWQQNMFFYLTTLCLQWFTSEDAPEVPEGTSDKVRFVIVEAWKHSNFLFRNYILSGLQDDLYNVYNGTKTSKEL